MYLTPSEKERIAYNMGNTKAASLYADLVDAENSESQIEDARCYIGEAKAMLPCEDFLQELIVEGQQMCKARITKEDMVKFVQRMEDLQGEIARTFEAIESELKNAQKRLDGESV